MCCMHCNENGVQWCQNYVDKQNCDLYCTYAGTSTRVSGLRQLECATLAPTVVRRNRLQTDMLGLCRSAKVIKLTFWVHTTAYTERTDWKDVRTPLTYMSVESSVLCALYWKQNAETSEWHWPTGAFKVLFRELCTGNRLQRYQNGTDLQDRWKFCVLCTGNRLQRHQNGTDKQECWKFYSVLCTNNGSQRRQNSTDLQEHWRFCSMCFVLINCRDIRMALTSRSIESSVLCAQTWQANKN